MKKPYLFGIDSFGDLAVKADGNLTSYAEAIRLVTDEAILADTLGIDAVALGEHHRDEFAISSPETILAGIATKTKRIKLGSGVTVLSSDDPVRIFQRFATLDALSNGRAQVILGRGSFTESFPLFGYDLEDYELLFEEKIALFAEILKERPVTWSGTTRSPLQDADIFPKTESGKLETLVGVGGSPKSVVRAAKYDFPLMLAIIGGDPARFKGYADLYRQATEEFGTTNHPIGVHSPGLIADTDEAAFKMAWPLFKRSFDKIGRSRGWAPWTPEHFDHEVQHGSLYVGSPETVAKKITRTLQVVGAHRFDIVYGFGQMDVTARRRHIELYATEVIPRVKKMLSS